MRDAAERARCLKNLEAAVRDIVKVNFRVIEDKESKDGKVSGLDWTDLTAYQKRELLEKLPDRYVGLKALKLILIDFRNFCPFMRLTVPQRFGALSLTSMSGLVVS